MTTVFGTLTLIYSIIHRVLTVDHGMVHPVQLECRLKRRRLREGYNAASAEGHKYQVYPLTQHASLCVFVHMLLSGCP